jgi:hypothetical protein
MNTRDPHRNSKSSAEDSSRTNRENVFTESRGQNEIRSRSSPLIRFGGRAFLDERRTTNFLGLFPITTAGAYVDANVSYCEPL